MYETIKNSIYKIVTADGTGTGFKLEDYDYIVTNYHVVKGHKRVSIEDNEKDRYIAHVVLVDPEVDLALLTSEELKDRKGAIKLSAKTTPKNMQKIYIYGFPFGMPLSTTEGIISSINQPVNDRYYIQTDAAVNPGNSGGAMVDEDGYLVAVTASKFTDADNVGFGIKHTDLLQELEGFNFNDNTFRLKCSSCGNLLEKESEFCQNCGNKIDSLAFEDYKLSSIASFTESALSALTKDTLLLRSGRNYWQFYQEKILIRIFTYEENNEEFLFCTSPLNELPKENLENLFLQIITKDKSPFILGISENKIYISYRLNISDTKTDQKETIKQNIADFPLQAVALSKYFHETYKCDFSFESKI